MSKNLEHLNNIFNAYKKLRKLVEKGLLVDPNFFTGYDLEIPKDDRGNELTLKNQLHIWARKYFFPDAMPKIIDDYDYILLSENQNVWSDEYYHGFEENEYFIQFLTDEKRNYGSGIFSSGFYVTMNKSKAKIYTDKAGIKYNTDKLIMPCKICGAKGIEMSDLINGIMFPLQRVVLDNGSPDKMSVRNDKIDALVEFVKNGNEDDLKKAFLNYLIFNCIDVVAMFLGYDYVNSDDNDWMVIYNTSKINVSKRTVEKALENSDNYQSDANEFDDDAEKG